MQPIRLRMAVMLAGVCLAPHAEGANEMMAYGVANFGGTGQCTNGSTHSVHNDTPHDFAEVFEELMSAGKWDTANVRTNMAVRGTLFTDTTRTGTCTCAGSCSCASEDEVSGVGADSADVMFIHTHGSHKMDVPRSGLAMGNSGFDCSVTTNQNMLWNSDLEIAVIKACQSGDYDVWQAGGYGKTFSTQTAPLTVWNAFHGNSSCSWFSTGGEVNDYAWDSQGEGVGENWLDEFYYEWIGSDNDDCPVSIVMGETGAKRDAMYRHGGWRDRKDTGLHNRSSYFYIVDCDPEKGVQLPTD